MKKLAMKGKDVKEAVNAASKVLGKGIDEIEYRVINEGKSGVLGVFGGEDAEIEAWGKTSPGEEAKNILQEILDKLGLMAIAEKKRDENGEIELNIKGEDLGQIIGKDGATLKALQTVMVAIIGNIYKEKIRVYVDAGGYKERHEKALERLALDAAKDVEESGKEKVLPPMTAADRRIIHICLKDSDKITTYSQGEGADRRLVIAPK